MGTKMVQVELNSKYSTYSKQGSSKGGANTALDLLKIKQQQANKRK